MVSTNGRGSLESSLGRCSEGNRAARPAVDQRRLADCPLASHRERLSLTMTRKEALTLQKELNKLGRTGTYVYKSDDGWTLGQTKGRKVVKAKSRGGDLFFHCVRAF